MELDGDAAERLARVMQGLASPSRLQLLVGLDGGARTVSSLVEETGMPQATVSNHLRLLRDLDLVSASRDGRMVYYALRDEHVRELLTAAVSHVVH